MIFGLDFSTSYLGIRLWIWLYLIFSVFMLTVAVAIFFQEILRKKYYEIRFPERLIKIVMHYEGAMFKVYWRLIPEKEHFMIGKQVYQFAEKNLIRENDFFAYLKDNKPKVKIDGKEYDLMESMQIKYRWSRYPEIHYFYNVPLPIDFRTLEKKIEFTSEQLGLFKENDLFNKLLTLQENFPLLLVVLIGCVLNLLLSAFIIAKLIGWLDK